MNSTNVFGGIFVGMLSVALLGCASVEKPAAYGEPSPMFISRAMRVSLRRQRWRFRKVFRSIRMR